MKHQYHFFTSFISSLVVLTVLLTLSPIRTFGEENTYIVKKGENLFRISQKFNLSLNDLLKFNPHIKDPDKVGEGTRLLIPGSLEGKKHIIKPGENLYRLSILYGLPLEKLLQTNGLTEDSILKVNDSIIIPGLTGFEKVQYVDDPLLIEDPIRDPKYWKQGVPFWPHPGEIKRLDGELYGKLAPGVEILGKEGDKIISVSPGTVEWASPFRGFGKVVMVKSHTGHNFVYGGIDQLHVNVGDRVIIGTDLGSLGVYHHEDAAKVFFFVSKGGKLFDPQNAPRS